MRVLTASELHIPHGALQESTEILLVCAFAFSIFVLPTTVAVLGYEMFTGGTTLMALTKASTFAVTSVGSVCAYMYFTDY